ncbi:protein eva-1 homolog C-like isoform X2 [Lineus longissimus]|uniref:protein eva-1 homolog C-like isoform X2 n=1 Tax=Lineus longissimus TaxID=88925 RepID=UPI00315CA9D0
MPWSWSWNTLGLIFASLAYISDSKDSSDSNYGRLSSTLYTFQEHACSGETLKLRCPQDTTLSIQFAQFGRQVPSHQMCPSKPGSLLPQSSQEEDTNCLATTSLEVVLKACQEKRHCSVEATSDTFGQDPCAGTTKYLEVAYKCRPNEFKSQLACEGQEMVLYCPKKKTRIAIYSAMFGRTAEGTDECPSYSGDEDQECQSTYTLDEVMKRCHGRRQCMVEANEHIFGDPCPPRMKKYLHVIFTCVQKRILKELKREPSIRGHVAPDLEKDRRKPRPRPVEIDLPDAIQQEPKLPIQTNWEPEETGSSHLSINGTTLPTEEEVCNTSLSSSNQFMIGFISDWISTYNFILDHREKAILYFVLGTCGGLVCLLLVIIFKIVTHRQNRKKKSVEITPEEIRGRRLSRPPGAHHSLLLEDADIPLAYNTDTVQSNQSDQGNGIEVIRYNSRVPLRTSGESGNRTLNHYYT